jgi:hypothetical protein
MSGPRPRDTHNKALIHRWIEHSKQFLVWGQSLFDLCQGTQARGEGGATPVPDILQLSERLLETRNLELESKAKVAATIYDDHLGLVPSEAKKGDVAWILKRSSVPVVLGKSAAQMHTHSDRPVLHSWNHERRSLL